MPQEKDDSNNSEEAGNAYFLSLEIENVRCFSERQNIDFSDGNDNPKQWTIILGDNGTGKTTILQCLAAATTQGLAHYLESSPSRLKLLESSGGKTPITGFSSKRARAGALIGSLFSSGAAGLVAGPLSGILVAALAGYVGAQNLMRENLEYKFPQNNLLLGFAPTFFIGNSLDDKRGRSLILSWKDLENFENSLKNLENLFVFGYGASRTVGSSSLSLNEEIDYCGSLFSDKGDLGNAEEWLLQADYARKSSPESEKASENLEKIKTILCKILPDVNNIRFTQLSEQEVPKAEFETYYGWVSFRDLSLGYRILTAWVIDLATKMFRRYPESENPLAEPSVVLIDEIDLHLHPKWQRELLDYLSNLFPNTQFIVTTHSPLIVQSAAARDANIVVCRREGDHVVIDQSVEAVRNWRADQILTSDLFGLETARPKEIEKEMLERQEILSKAKLTKKDEKRLKELEEKIGSVPVMENPKYDEAMDIILRAAEKLEKQNGTPK